MRLKFWDRSEERAGDAGSAIAAAIIAGYRGQAPDSDGTATAVSAIGIIGRLFASATVTAAPEIQAAITSPMLADVARQVLLHGNWVAQIEPSAVGLGLLPVAGFEVVGGAFDPDLWVYDLDIPVPRGTVRRQELGGGLIHVRWNASRSTPWQGQSPLSEANLTAAALANVEQRLGEEANARIGYLLQYPDGTSASDINNLTNDLGTMRGGVKPVAKSGAGLNVGLGARAPSEWDLMRLGATIPETSIMLSDTMANRVMTALGVSPQLWAGAGVDMREAARQLHVSMLDPLGKLVSAELSAKLGGPVDVVPDGDGLIDVGARADAIATLVTAGMPLDEAKQVAGVGRPQTAVLEGE